MPGLKHKPVNKSNEKLLASRKIAAIYFAQDLRPHQSGMTRSVAKIMHESIKRKSAGTQDGKTSQL